MIACETNTNGAAQACDLLLAVHRRFEHLDSTFRLAREEDGLLASSARELWETICEEVKRHTDKRRPVPHIRPRPATVALPIEEALPPRATVRIVMSESRLAWR